MLTPEAQAKIAEHKANREGWIRGERPLIDSRFGAKTIGAITQITPGVEIWTREDGRRDWHNEPIGGIVLHVDPGRPSTVNDDGEIIDHPARYRCYDPLAQVPLYKAFVTLSEPEINPRSIAIPDEMSVVIAIRRFCREASLGGIGLDTTDAQLVTDAYRLVTVLMGGHHR